jgi:hypothetical protein
VVGAESPGQLEPLRDLVDHDDLGGPHLLTAAACGRAARALQTTVP